MIYIWLNAADVYLTKNFYMELPILKFFDNDFKADYILGVNGFS